MKVMNKQLQIVKAKQILSKKGINTDLVDFESLIDSKLSLPENLTLIEEETTLLISDRIELLTEEYGKYEDQTDIYRYVNGGENTATASE